MPGALAWDRGERSPRGYSNGAPGAAHRDLEEDK